MEDFEQQVIDELNTIRTSPQEYSKIIRGNIKNFNGTLLHLPGQNLGIQTKEGAKAYEEAAEYLERQKRINALQLNYSLCKIAKEFIMEVQKTDIYEAGNIELEPIIEKYGHFDGSLSRAIDFGGTTPEMIITNLLVSDGDESRIQRQSMFNDKLNLIGVATATHDQYGQCTVILTCTKFFSNNPEDDNYFFDQEKKVNTIGQPYIVKSTPPNRFTQASPHNQKENIGGDPDCPEGVKKVIKTENEIVEGGKRKKIVKIIKYMEDGSINTVIEKEIIG